MNYINYLSRIFAAGLGIVWCYIEPTLPYAIICVFAVLLDCLTAWRLNCRVKTAYPKGGADGKFKSQHAMKMVSDLLIVWFCILLADGVDHAILSHIDLYLPNYVAAIFCFVEFWSVLENESSQRPDAAWARLLQRFVVDKTKRHLDIDVEDMLHKDEKEPSKRLTD